MKSVRLVVSALAVPIELRVDASAAPDQDLHDFVESWAWCRAHVSSVPRRTLRGTLDPRAGSRIDDANDLLALPEHITAPSLDELAERLVQGVTRIALAHQPDNAILLHAAGLAHPETGAVVALVGPSGAGKSTATRALGPRFVYLSDESVAIAASGRVARYPKPVSVKVPGSPFKSQMAPASLDFVRSGSGPLRLRRILVLDREDAHTGAPITRRLSFAEAVETILPETSYFSRGHRPLAAFAELLDRCGGAYSVRYREATDLIAVVADLLDDRHLVETLTRASVQDEHVSEDGLILLRDGVVQTYAGIGPTVWQCLNRPRTRESLVAALASECLPATDSTEESVVARIETSVQALIEAGALEAARLPR